MIVKIGKEKNAFSKELEPYMELVAETIKEERLLEKIHFNFDFGAPTSLLMEGYLNPRRRRSKKVSLKILGSRQPA